MRIAFDHQAFSGQIFGGISRYFFEVSRNLPRASGYAASAKIIAPFYRNNYLAYANNHLFMGGIKVSHLRGIGILNSFLTPLLLKIYKPDVIHATYYSCCKINVGKVKKVITVFDMIHELFPDQFSRNDKTALAKKNAISNADHIICISRSTQNDLIKILGVDPKRTSVVHLGFTFENPKILANKRSTKPYLLYVGSRYGYKNFSKLVEAYGGLPSISNFFDLVAFGGGEFKSEEIALFERLKIRQNSIKHVSGDDAKLAEYYRDASLFVYPSLYEGFGIPPLEAMSYGCPVARSNTSSIPEVVGDAGIYFDPTSKESIANSIESVLEDLDLKATLILRGFERIKSFSWNKCALETYHVYRRLLQ